MVPPAKPEIFVSGGSGGASNIYLPQFEKYVFIIP